MSTGTTDLVYVLGSGSTANDWELRMSLRSVWAHFPARRHVWLVGHCPPWIAPGSVRHLPHLDPWTSHKDANLIAKLITAALHPEVSERFVFMSDDQLFLRETHPEDFRAWHCGELTDETPKGIKKWEHRLWHTGAALRAAGLPSYHWDAHVPYLMTKAGVRKMAEWPWGKPPGFTVSTLYHGINEAEPVPIVSDRIRGDLRKKGISDKVVTRKLSRNRFALLGPDSFASLFLIQSIERLFPAPSPCEGDRQAASAVVVPAPPPPRREPSAPLLRPFRARPACPVLTADGKPLIVTR